MTALALLETVIRVLLPVVALVNLAVAFIWWRRFRRLRVLEILLERIVVEAFLFQTVHPVWRTWEHSFKKRIEFKLVIHNEGEEGRHEEG